MSLSSGSNLTFPFPGFIAGHFFPVTKVPSRAHVEVASKSLPPAPGGKVRMGASG